MARDGDIALLAGKWRHRVVTRSLPQVGNVDTFDDDLGDADLLDLDLRHRVAVRRHVERGGARRRGDGGVGGGRGGGGPGARRARRRIGRRRAGVLLHLLIEAVFELALLACLEDPGSPELVGNEQQQQDPGREQQAADPPDCGAHPRQANQRCRFDRFTGWFVHSCRIDRSEASVPVVVVRLRSAVCLLGRFPALAGVDLDVAEGEIVLLSGANGAGKTTLLRLLAGLVPLYSGEASVLGHDLADDRRSARRDLALMGHETFCYDDLTARRTCASRLGHPVARSRAPMPRSSESAWPGRPTPRTASSPPDSVAAWRSRSRFARPAPPPPR